MGQELKTWREEEDELKIYTYMYLNNYIFY